MALVFLLRFENSGTTITDEVPGNTWTASGGATQSTTSPITGLSSLDLSSAEGGVSSTTAAVVNNLAGTRDWRMDVRIKGTTTPPWFFTSLIGSNVWNLNLRDSNELDFEGANSGNQGGFASDGSPHLLTASYVNSTQRVYLFIDGTLVANVAYGASFSVPSVVWVGKSTGADTGWRGKLDEARYLINESVTASFTDDGLPFAGPGGGASTATAAAGVATVSGAGSSRAATAGTAAAGAATVSASAKATTTSTATAATGIAAVSGAGRALGRSQGQAAGSATVAASGSSGAVASASSAGVANVSGEGSALSGTTATPAAGSATASAVGSTMDAGQTNAVPAAGVATVSAQGSSVVAASAVPAAGSAEVSATSPSGSAGGGYDDRKKQKRLIDKAVKAANEAIAAEQAEAQQAAPIVWDMGWHDDDEEVLMLLL